MKPIVFFDFIPDKDDPNNKIVIKKADLEELLDKTYEAGYQDGHKEPKMQFYTTQAKDFNTTPKVQKYTTDISF